MSAKSRRHTFVFVTLVRPMHTDLRKMGFEKRLVQQQTCCGCDLKRCCFCRIRKKNILLSVVLEIIKHQR